MTVITGIMTLRMKYKHSRMDNGKRVVKFWHRLESGNAFTACTNRSSISRFNSMVLSVLIPVPKGGLSRLREKDLLMDINFTNVK